MVEEVAVAAVGETDGEEAAATWDPASSVCFRHHYNQTTKTTTMGHNLLHTVFGGYPLTLMRGLQHEAASWTGLLRASHRSV